MRGVALVLAAALALQGCAALDRCGESDGCRTVATGAVAACIVLVAHAASKGGHNITQQRSPVAPINPTVPCYQCSQ